MEKEEKFDLEEEYGKYKKKYDLPDFNILLEDFDVEKIIDKETKFLLRDIRRVMNDKFSAYLHLFENLINPGSPPMFVFHAIRGLNGTEKESVKNIYKDLSKIQIEVLKLDTIYNEKSEAEFVVKYFSLWQEMKKEVIKIIEKFGEAIEKQEASRDRGYFG